MAVPEQTPYIEHTGNGVTTSFALKFQCESKDHLIVLVDDVEPPIASWSLTGGNVVFTTAPASGRKITLQRNTPFSRNTDYQSYNNSFRPPAVNKDFDWIWWKLQELGVADWILGNRISALKNYVDRKDDELKAYLMEEIRKQGVALDQLDEYYNYLMQQLAQIAVNKGWLDSYVVTWTGRTQEFENKRMSKARLGQRVLHTNLSSSIDAGSHKYPQGGCKVGDSIFLKIGTNNGVVGEYTEEFIIAEYDFNTGAKIAETAPMITLGHHELNGFIKDGKTYLVTSYQPQVSSNNQSGAGASFIEWKGSATTLDNVTGYKLLNELEYIGYPAVDEKGEYLYIAHTYYGTATHDGFVTGVDINRAPVIRIHAYKVSELNPTYNNPLYTFQVECPAGDGNNLSNAINGFTATSDHVYLAFGAAYGNCEIHKYTTSGDIVERVVTYHARAARPFNEIVTPTLFLYNAEPEGCFVADGKMYLICAEDWYGLGEIVRYHGKYYMARYTMTGLSPASHTQNWVDLPYVPESFTEYSATTTYQGRNTSIGEFKRSIIEIGLKSPTLSYDLLGANGSNSVPNIINNMSDRVHIYGTLINGNAMTFGQYNPNRQSFQKNMTLTANELLIYDTRSPTKLNTKAAALQSYQQNTNNMTRLRASSTSTTWFDVYGVNHNIDNVPNIPYAYAARIMVDSKESVSFYKDGRLYNRSYNSNGVAAKFYTQESETLSLFQGVNATYIDTTNQYTWLGQVGGGVHGTATIGMNHSNKTVFPPTDGATELGTRELKWGRVATKDLILQPSTTLLPVNNGELVFEATSNTTVTIKLKGSDGIVRSTSLQLI